MLACTATIEIHNRKEIYVPGDTLSGVVNIVQTSAVSVKEVVIKLRGKVRVSAGDGRRRSVAFANLHHHELVLFPPRELVDNNFGKGFTLNKGTYTYPFEFEIPGHGSGAQTPLCPTLTIDAGLIYIRYYLKVTVRRTARLAPNARTEVDLVTSPCVDERLLHIHTTRKVTKPLILGSSSLNVNPVMAMFVQHEASEPTFEVTLEYPEVGIMPNSRMNSGFSLLIAPLAGARDLKNAVIASVVVNLVQVGTYRTLADMSRSVARIEISSKTHRHRIVNDVDPDLPVDLSTLIQGTKFPWDLMPSFTINLIDQTYLLHVGLEFTYEYKGKQHRKILDIYGRVPVLSRYVHTHESDPEYEVEEAPDLPRYLADPEPGPPVYIAEEHGPALPQEAGEASQNTEFSAMLRVPPGL